jgi:two-component system KDP operon response regulator KdpE
VLSCDNAVSLYHKMSRERQSVRNELEMAILERIKTRRRGAATPYDDGRLRIDLERRRVYRQGETTHLTPIEFQLLSYLLRHRGQVVPYKELLTEVWGPAYVDATDCLYLYIHYLRAKVEENPSEPQYIRTKRGVGYRFAPTGGTP